MQALLGVKGGKSTLQIISGRTREVQRWMKVNSRSFVMAIIAKKTKKANTVLEYYTIRILTTMMSEKNQENY